MSFPASIAVATHAPSFNHFQITEKSASPIDEQNVSQRLAKAKQGFLQAWTQFGEPREPFSLWSSHWDEKKLHTLFEQLDNEREAIYKQNAKPGQLFFLPEEAKELEQKKYDYPVSFEYNRASDSYNASIIHIHGLRFIAMEAPMEDTLGEFTHILKTYKASTLVRLTPKEEDAEVECTPYWEGSYGNTLTLPGGEQIFYISTDTWKDAQGLPVADLYSLVKEARDLNKNDDSIVAVHCAAGMGRTGTFIAAYVIAYDIDAYLAEGKDINQIRLSIQKLVWELSLQRGFSVSEFVQLQALYNFTQYYLDQKQLH